MGAVGRDDEAVRRRQLPQLLAGLLGDRDLLRLRRKSIDNTLTHVSVRMRNVGAAAQSALRGWGVRSQREREGVSRRQQARRQAELLEER